MADPASFARMVPGFDFLQGLMKNAGSALPAMNQWIAPTLDPDELDKRIGELRTVQFWLEQNAKMIGVTIQALEVQRMTLATLRTMNLPLSEVRDSLTLSPTGGSSFGSASRPPAPSPADADADADADAPEAPAMKPPRKSAPGTRAASAAPATPAVDPMQWWGALTQQFGELAAQALKDTPAALKGIADAATTPHPAAAPSASSAPVAGASKPARARRSPRRKPDAG
jgi:hypothetical protein